MSIEDDHEYLAEQMKRAMASIAATQPDILVFSLRGTEIRDRLVKMAETAEAEAARISGAANLAKSNVRPMSIQRPIHRAGAGPALPSPPGYGPYELSDEAQRDMNEMVAKTYLRAAEDFRFLASHVDEDRLFRLATHDMQCLGFTFAPMSIAIPSAGYR
jgi:hypothetical protein